jgi:hypothetical protein
MPTLSPTQLYSQARAAGFSPLDATVAAAIALAESGGNTDAKGTNKDGSIDRGAWQINSRWHPEITDVCATDPTCSANAAFSISRGGKDFTPWTTYTSGAYKSFTGTVNASVGLSSGGFVGALKTLPLSQQSPNPGPTTSPNWWDGIVKNIESVGTTLSGLLLAMALLIGGIVLLIGPEKIEEGGKRAAIIAAKAI